MVLLLVSTNDCVTFCHTEAFLLNFIAVTAVDVIFLLLYSLFLIIWSWLFPTWCYTLLILTRLLYGGLILLIIVLFTLSHVFFSFSLFVNFIPPFLLRILLFLRFYHFLYLSFGTDWSWVSRCFCGQLPSSLLSLIVEYIFILPSWSCQNLMLDLLTISLFWIAL